MPRRLMGATTSSSESSLIASTTLSTSLNRANRGVAGSVCSDFRPSQHWRSSAFPSSRLTMRPLFVSRSSICSSNCLSSAGSSGRSLGIEIMPWVYTESGHESRRQYLMRTVTPKVRTVEHPVEFLDGQDNRFVRHVRRVRSMNPTYHMMGQQVTVASLASSSTAEELRSRPPTMHTAGAQVRGAATYRAPGR